MRDKPRLYLALYARLNSQAYHYALHITPKNESPDPFRLETTKYHCVNHHLVQQCTGETANPWIVEVMKINPTTDGRLLCRILLGKIKAGRGSLKAAEDVFTHVPIFQDDETYDSTAWVRLALLQLDLKALVRWGWPGGMEANGWDFVEKTSTNYVTSKKAQGRYEVGGVWEGAGVPTYDTILAQELVP